MRLEDLGYNESFEKFRKENIPAGFGIGRVTAEHKERYIVATGLKEYEAEITGNMRFKATSWADFPAVGDWVAITLYNQGFALIHEILPRFSLLKRQAVGKFAEIQLITANIDFAFIVQSADRDFKSTGRKYPLLDLPGFPVKEMLVITSFSLSGKQ